MKKLILLFIWGGVKPRIVFHLKLMSYFNQRGMINISKYLSSRLQVKYGVFISHKATIGTGLSLRHPIALVVGEGVTIGNNVVLYQSVTLGGARQGDSQRNKYPVIGDETVVYAGAVIVGDVKIGKNCVIGANSVVLDDVPDNCVAVGAPARVLKVRK